MCLAELDSLSIRCSITLKATSQLYRVKIAYIFDLWVFLFELSLNGFEVLLE